MGHPPMGLSGVKLFRNFSFLLGFDPRHPMEHLTWSFLLVRTFFCLRHNESSVSPLRVLSCQEHGLLIHTLLAIALRNL